MLPINKIYIDTRFKSNASASSSDFQTDLPTTYYMPDNTGFFVGDVCIPDSWYAIDQSKKIYVQPDTGGVYIAELTPGDYSIVTLCDEIARAMLKALGPDTKKFGGDRANFSGSANFTTNTITISSTTMSFNILTDNQLTQITHVPPPFYSMNTILNNSVDRSAYSESWTSGYINLAANRNLYIISPNLGNFQTLSISGESGIIKKSPSSSKLQRNHVGSRCCLMIS